MGVIKWLSDLRSGLLLALATKFHYLILIGIVTGIALTLLINRPDFAIRGIIYIVPGILITILLWKLYQKGKKYPDSLVLMKGNEKIFQIIFVSVFVISILALYFSVYRPWYYFVLITALFCIIFLQIFKGSLTPSIILAELSCVMGNIIFGLQLKYPYYYGFSDIIPHLIKTEIVLLSGHIIPEDLSYSYAWFPLFHIYIAEGANLLGMDVKLTFIILTSLAFIALIWILYPFFNLIVKNDRTSLLICLIFSTTPVVITYSTYVVTRTMAFIGFIFFLYLAHKQIQTSKWRSFSVLTILFSLYLILVHQVSILQILVLLFLFIIIEIIINDYFAIKTKIIAFIIVTFSTYWIFTSFFFASIIVQTADSTSIEGLSQLRSTIQTGNEFIFLWENFSTAIIIFFVMLGAGYLCWAYRAKYPTVIGLFALIMSPLYFPSPMTASSWIMQTFRMDRFSLLVSPFFAYTMAIGFLFILYTLHDNKYTRKIAIVFGLLIFSYLCFSALTGDNATDSPDLTSHRSKLYFSESELYSFNFIPQFVEFNSTISTDTRASRMFEQPFFSQTKALGLPSYHNAWHTIYTTEPYTFDGFFILRNQELENNGLAFELNSGTNFFMPTETTFLEFSDMTYAAQKIYDNRKVSILAN